MVSTCSPFCDVGAIARMRLDLDVGREFLECRDRERQARDHAGLARDHDRAGRRVFRDRRNRGDVAGAAEILVERAVDGLVDRKRRQERFGMQQ